MPNRRFPLIFAAVAALLPTVAIATPAAAEPKAAVVAEKRVDARTLDLTLSSPELGRQADVRLLLPDGWDGR